MSQRKEFFGKYRGIVTNTNDPQNMGRIKARVPAVTGDCETGWCMPCLPYPVSNNGISFLPPVGSCVWIEFERGNASYPIWVGCWYSTANTGVNTFSISTPQATLSFSGGDVNATNSAGQTLNVATILQKFEDLKDWCNGRFQLK